MLLHCRSVLFITPSSCIARIFRLAKVPFGPSCTTLLSAIMSAILSRATTSDNLVDTAGHHLAGPLFVIATGLFCCP
ncbi:MAG: hypothetical protein J3Q66DRAFT_327988 [Benniella sp.]|nr:MAG: hypothetical protein J3Q66DRAFT_327988 [Benniella sp.]